MIITALNCAYSRHLTLRDLRSYCLLYVATVVHLLKLLAKIEKKTEHGKVKAENFLIISQMLICAQIDRCET